MKRLLIVLFGVFYMFGYWYYFLTTLYLAWPKYTLSTLAVFAIPQLFISILWPIWQLMGHRPFLP
jgi:hypothetical protein